MRMQDVVDMWLVALSVYIRGQKHIKPHANMTVGINIITFHEVTCHFPLYKNISFLFCPSHSLSSSICSKVSKQNTSCIIYSQERVQNINYIFPSFQDPVITYFSGVDWGREDITPMCESKPPEKNNPIYPTMHLFTFPASLWTTGSVWSLIRFSAVSCPPDEGF